MEPICENCREGYSEHYSGGLGCGLWLSPERMKEQEPPVCLRCSRPESAHAFSRYDNDECPFGFERELTAEEKLADARRTIDGLHEALAHEQRINEKLTPEALKANVNPRTGDPFQVAPSSDSSNQLMKEDVGGRHPFEDLMANVPEILPAFGAATGDGYDLLRKALGAALEQAMGGKGKERHAGGGEAFEDQQIMRFQEWTGSNHFTVGQCAKKAIESTRLPPDRARAELLGAIVYAAAAYAFLLDK